MLVRVQLIFEEGAELARAYANRDIIGVIDALGDLDVVVSGAWLCMGLQSLRRAVSAEILRSNLSKLDPVTGKLSKSPGGRTLKGPHYSPPNLDPILNAHLTFLNMNRLNEPDELENELSFHTVVAPPKVDLSIHNGPMPPPLDFSRLLINQGDGSVTTFRAPHPTDNCSCGRMTDECHICLSTQA